MAQSVEASRSQINDAVAAFLDAVAQSPETHQEGRDYAMRHGRYSQTVENVGGTCRAFYLSDGTMEWEITLHALTDLGLLKISETTRTWVVLDDVGSGALTPVADSNQAGTTLPPQLFTSVATEIEAILHTYQRVWLPSAAPAPVAQPAQPLITRQQIAQQADKPVSALIASVVALFAGWCFVLFGWIALGVAAFLVIRKWRRLNGAPMSGMLLVAAITTGVAALSVLGSTVYVINNVMAYLNSSM